MYANESYLALAAAAQGQSVSLQPIVGGYQVLIRLFKSNNSYK